MGEMRAVGDLVSRAIGFTTGGSPDRKRPLTKPLDLTPSGRLSSDHSMGVGLVDDNASAEGRGSCPTCKGKGFYVLDVHYGHPDFGRLFPCRCASGGRHEASPLMELDIPEDVQKATFANVFRRPEIVAALEMAERLAGQRHGLLTLWGPPGVGKSEVLGCVRNAARCAGIPCLYAEAIKLFRELKKQIDADSGPGIDEIWERVLNTPVLCLDDLHAITKTGWVWERVTELICSRYDHRRDRLTCIATNEPVDSLARTSCAAGLCDSQCHVIEVAGSDVRRRKR